LRETAYDLSSSSSDNSEDCTEYVINISFFHNYETKKADQQISEKKQSYTYYWHQAIFEAFNEYLDEFRPFGVYGQPYVWEVDGRTHSNYTKVSNFKVHHGLI
jgi:inner membrane protein involved in colicin E2 resistance